MFWDLRFNLKVMSKDKERKNKNDKTAPAKTLKEKRVAKEEKRKDKRGDNITPINIKPPLKMNLVAG